jgi:hypothetical protein
MMHLSYLDNILKFLSQGKPCVLTGDLTCLYSVATQIKKMQFKHLKQHLGESKFYIKGKVKTAAGE